MQLRSHLDLAAVTSDSLRGLQPAESQYAARRAGGRNKHLVVWGKHAIHLNEDVLGVHGPSKRVCTRQNRSALPSPPPAHLCRIKWHTPTREGGRLRKERGGRVVHRHKVYAPTCAAATCHHAGLPQWRAALRPPRCALPFALGGFEAVTPGAVRGAASTGDTAAGSLHPHHGLQPHCAPGVEHAGRQPCRRPCCRPWGRKRRRPRRSRMSPVAALQPAFVFMLTHFAYRKYRLGLATSTFATCACACSCWSGTQRVSFAYVMRREGGRRRPARRGSVAPAAMRTPHQ